VCFYFLFFIFSVYFCTIYIFIIIIIIIIRSDALSFFSHIFRAFEQRSIKWKIVSD